MLSYARTKYVDTVPEVLVQDWLYKAGFNFRKHGEIKGAREIGLQHQYDIVIDEIKTVIEIDGCFWHGHSACFKEWELLPDIDERGARDKRITEAAENLGWTLIRRWECEVKKDPACICVSHVEEVAAETTSERYENEFDALVAQGICWTKKAKEKHGSAYIAYKKATA